MIILKGIVLSSAIVVYDIIHLGGSSLEKIALWFGDMLFLKHLITKWLALKLSDVNISLFMESHLELYHSDRELSHHGHDHEHTNESQTEENRPLLNRVQRE